MKAIEAATHGIPAEVCQCVEVDDPSPPDAGEVIIEIEAAPINPADLLMIQGLYPGVSEFPSRLGIEGVGRVARIGNGVDGLKFGDRVISLARTNWAERVSLSAAQVVPVPKTVDALQLAMLKANPATAHLILRDYVSIGAGDWIIHNAVNYGFLSGEPCHVTPDQLILRGLTLKGFWLAPKFGTMKPVEIRSHYDHLVQLFADGTLSVPVEETYTIDQARDALSHAMREGRNGKILITANRPVG
ncbi:MAG: hypothetical protein CFH05_00619 [Alphaproteobacteria bacterium MarineAlpha3_Bin4]|nr:MAG: hypothetical protein CFH05_00619 [Alphaproteobacteria bacterium MarineAlpha3_Bin4]